MLFGEDADAQLAAAERELLEARATYTVQRKAVDAILMTDPTLKAVHLKAMSPPERYVVAAWRLISEPRLKCDRTLFGLVNRRDVLSLALENLITARQSTLEELSELELGNLRINQKNQKLVQELLQLTSSDLSWQDEVKEAGLKDQLERLEADERKIRANWDVMKSIASAIVVGSGVDWAGDEVLRALVLNEED